MENALTFQDIFKKSFLRLGASGSVSTGDVVLVLCVTLLMGLFIFYVYRKTFLGVLYTQSFNLSLIVLSLVTSMVIVTVSSNITLSLGMVGALSIVRFRTAIKEPLDVVFMFWAITVGIANGAFAFKISLIGSLVIAAILFLMTRFRWSHSPYLLVVNHSGDGEKLVQEEIRKIPRARLKSRVVSRGNVELTMEVRMKDGDSGFVDDLSKIPGVQNAVLVSYHGDGAV